MEQGYNRHPISLRQGKVFFDGVEVMDSIALDIVWTWETWSGKQLGDRSNTNMPLGYDIKATMTQYRTNSWMKDAIKAFKETGRVPEIKIQGIQGDKASDYYIAHGSETVTAVGCTPTGSFNLLKLDSKGEILEDTLEFAVADVLFG